MTFVLGYLVLSLLSGLVLAAIDAYDRRRFPARVLFEQSTLYVPEDWSR